jgi:hypothetical protein
MPCIEPVMKPKDRRLTRIGSPIRKNQHEPSPSGQSCLCDSQISPSAVIEVGNSLFIVKSGDSHLIHELRTFCETIREHPRAELRFTHKLIHCTEEGRLEPWGWQRQPGRAC